ncbi:hypothetical protein SSP24_69430 [Streptomyces spinoverrucosus]|uniref:DNA-directed RNA polymerase specialized sigma24 family protein n=1 Tax=Streptomyces spinoverrucosus TaxID=284043 RepID=A0A4Y3VSS3_9ACTN|nr:hypothetical protein [Streptomyces spinoverrucosus]GEC09288.1 hypothetical protein SSP24_69430 [Streptomyces spinoverrucosus]GHB44652.1 hypothetical protein GCM10010397_12940 [Streptomyces spinoverrucosus]
MQSQDVAPRPTSSASAPVVDVEQVEAALVEHYPRLVRLAYLVLPPGLGRNRRVLTAHALTQRALPRGRAAASVIPAQSTGRDGDPGYAFVRLQVLRTALEAGLPLRRKAWPKRSQLPPLLPQVWGLRLFPRSGGAEELALDQRLSALSAPARAAYVLRGLERLPDSDVHHVLRTAGVDDPDAALQEADGVPAQYALLDSPEFDPCSLQARPTDLMRRRQHLKAALAAAAALAVCGALLALPGDGWGPDGAAAPPYAQNPAAQAALDPSRLVKVSPAAWRSATRTDFSVWPARGDLTTDSALLRRALAVWARPGETVRVSATRGTPSGGPAGPPQLLFAGNVDNARVVVFYDGLRIARYAEPKDGTAGAALDFSRADGATRIEASAVLLNRTDGNVRYLTAPWVKKTAERDLLKPGSGAMNLALTDGITAPLASPVAQTGACASWNVLQITDDSGTRLMADLGELVPARLTTGRPGKTHDAAGAEALRTWAPYGCSLADLRGHGVRSVNAWQYAAQPLPDASGTAAWVCTRAETWRGGGERVLAQFHTPGGKYGAVAAKAENVAACGPRDPHVLAGVLWKSEAGPWYLLAAGSRDTASISTTGGVERTAQGNVLAAKTKQGVKAELKGTLTDGRSINGLG